MKNNESPQLDLNFEGPDKEKELIPPDVEAEAEKIRLEAPFKYLPKDDPAIYQLARMRNKFKKSGNPPYEFHGRNSD